MVNDADDFRSQIRTAVAEAPVAPRLPRSEARSTPAKRRRTLASLFRRRKGLPPPGGRAYGRRGGFRA
jgi:hypothetical protein